MVHYEGTRGAPLAKIDERAIVKCCGWRGIRRRPGGRVHRRRSGRRGPRRRASSGASGVGPRSRVPHLCLDFACVSLPRVPVSKRCGRKPITAPSPCHQTGGPGSLRAIGTPPAARAVAAPVRSQSLTDAPASGGSASNRGGRRRWPVAARPAASRFSHAAARPRGPERFSSSERSRSHGLRRCRPEYSR